MRLACKVEPVTDAGFSAFFAAGAALLAVRSAPQTRQRVALSLKRVPQVGQILVFLRSVSGDIGRDYTIEKLAGFKAAVKYLYTDYAEHTDEHGFLNSFPCESVQSVKSVSPLQKPFLNTKGTKATKEIQEHFKNVESWRRLS
jgi:hypothetical protein